MSFSAHPLILGTHYDKEVLSDPETRRRHMLVVGPTGTGKSTFLRSLVLQDVYNGGGCCFIDPHGPDAETLANSIPAHRIQDVLYFNVADTQHPLGINPFFAVPEEKRSAAASAIFEVLKQHFEESWGGRMQNLLRYTIKTLLEQPHNRHITFLAVKRLLVDPDFRFRMLERVHDQDTRDYWIREFGTMDRRTEREWIEPVINKMGEFGSNRELRNIIGQARPAFNFRKVMDEGKILIVNLSRPTIGADGVALLGSLLLSGFQQAAFSRIDTPEEERRDFSIIADEAQLFRAPTIAASIFSESRKFKLNLTIGTQHLEGLDERLRINALANVGSVAAFGVGARDGKLLADRFDPLDLSMLTETRVGEFCLSSYAGGRLQSPRFVHSLRPSNHPEASLERVVAYTRNVIGRNSNRAMVEGNIGKWLAGHAGRKQTAREKSWADELASLFPVESMKASGSGSARRGKTTGLPSQLAFGGG